MFGWSKKKETKRRGRPDNNLEENEFGIKLDKGPSDKQLEAELKALTGVDNFADDEINLNEGEEDVETELLRLVGGGNGRRGPKKPSAPIEGLGNVTSDISAGIEDIGDEDVEVDEDDPELLGELLELTQPEDAIEDEPEPESDSEPEATPSGESDVMTILKERLKMYKTAEAKAKENHESSRARRFSRGIKTLEDLIKKAKAGKTVSPNDIPPAIALNLKPALPVQETPSNEMEMNGGGMELGRGEETEQAPPQPETNQSSGEVDVMSTLMERLKLYQTAEAKAKESNEITRARRFNRGIKTLEGLIRQVKAGNPIAADDIPPAVALNLKSVPLIEQPQQNSEETLDSSEEKEEDEMGNINFSQTPSNESESKEVEPERNIMDVLSERLQIYKTAESKAKESGETTRARRFGRGIKTLEDLIRQATAGKPVTSSDIPPPIALNLKPAPPVVTNEEEEPHKAAVERDNLVRSSDGPFGPPLKFLAADDVDLDEELVEEEIPMTVLDGLEQRLRIYRNLKQKAEEEGDEVLADQSDRNVKIYLNAIRTFKSGGYVDVLSLPAPKGCPPIPIPFHVP